MWWGGAFLVRSTRYHESAELIGLLELTAFISYRLSLCRSKSLDELLD
jgi:hypothetical protein